MVRQAKGNPLLAIRLPQEVIDRLKQMGREKYPEVRGSSGGASRLVRDWIYEKLAEVERPEEWGERNPELNLKRRRTNRKHSDGTEGDDPTAKN